MKAIEKFAIEKALEEDAVYEEESYEYYRQNGHFPDGDLNYHSPIGFIGSLLLVVEPSELKETVEKWFEDFETETNLHKEDILAICAEYFEEPRKVEHGFSQSTTEY